MICLGRGLIVLRSPFVNVPLDDEIAPLGEAEPSQFVEERTMRGSPS
jgi:hypothetical protein